MTKIGKFVLKSEFVQGLSESEFNVEEDKVAESDFNVEEEKVAESEFNVKEDKVAESKFNVKEDKARADCSMLGDVVGCLVVRAVRASVGACRYQKDLSYHLRWGVRVGSSSIGATAGLVNDASDTTSGILSLFFCFVWGSLVLKRAELTCHKTSSPMKSSSFGNLGMTRQTMKHLSQAQSPSRIKAQRASLMPGKP
ncbi:hypothetical protein LWI29_029493 [Acer saccharum]|uniref:Uncharacterized protein n=1 Tax=Acer saccharum TaxID=4024 RepID=A0AA39VYH1_ACESA|nr:hypothetical protein LWI29_029493 [Acer saccharum]